MRYATIASIPVQDMTRADVINAVAKLIHENDPLWKSRPLRDLQKLIRSRHVSAFRCKENEQDPIHAPFDAKFSDFIIVICEGLSPSRPEFSISKMAVDQGWLVGRRIKNECVEKLIFDAASGAIPIPKEYSDARRIIEDQAFENNRLRKIITFLQDDVGRLLDGRERWRVDQGMYGANGGRGHEK